MPCSSTLSHTSHAATDRRRDARPMFRLPIAVYFPNRASSCPILFSSCRNCCRKGARRFCTALMLSASSTTCLASSNLRVFVISIKSCALSTRECYCSHNCLQNGSKPTSWHTGSANSNDITADTGFRHHGRHDCMALTYSVQGAR